jgi:hypothetical protein
MGGSATIALGGDDSQLAKLAERVGQVCEAGSEIAVVVREQDPHAYLRTAILSTLTR